MRQRIPLPEAVHQTLRESPIYCPTNPIQRLTPFHVPRTVERGPAKSARIFVTGHMIDQNPNKNRFPDNTENIDQV